MSLHNLCSWMITLGLWYALKRPILYGTCHKDLEQISSILSVELIFDIFYIHCILLVQVPDLSMPWLLLIIKAYIVYMEFCIRHS